ncbi:hypothetical protein EDD15DRAFT_2202514 [Pisolithus albus]|nr:hypothetical protein EDD15DRAFT_2202514 [Pisolithus albus]
MSKAELASIHSPSSQSAPGSEEIAENSIQSRLVTQRPCGWFMCWRSRVRLRKVLQQPGHLALGIVRWKIQEVAPRNSANPVCRLSISSKLSGKRNPSAVHSSPLAMVPSPPLETPEEAISLLRLLRADHNVSLAKFSLLDCEINRTTRTRLRRRGNGFSMRSTQLVMVGRSSLGAGTCMRPQLDVHTAKNLEFLGLLGTLEQRSGKAWNSGIMWKYENSGKAWNSRIVCATKGLVQLGRLAGKSRKAWKVWSSGIMCTQSLVKSGITGRLALE